MSPIRYYRKVIQIQAKDSPNVALGLLQQERGETPTGEVLIPGLLTWDEYVKRRKLWSREDQLVSLDAEFDETGSVKLFPLEDRMRSVQLAEKYQKENLPRRALALGVDSAEGGDDSVWTVIDHLGVIHQEWYRTDNTNDIPGITIGLIREYRILPENVVFDRGGGGKEHADRLRAAGYDVRTIGFGESATDSNRDRKTSSIRDVQERVEKSEIRYSYKNRRAEIYGLMSQMITSPKGFAIPARYTDLLKQLAGIPKKRDDEGRMWLPPKDKPNRDYKGETLKMILGRSPDHADSLGCAIFGMKRKPPQYEAGVL